MNTSQKAIETAKQLQEELNMRLGFTGATALLTSTLSFHALDATVSDAATLHPCVQFGTGVTTTASFCIVAKPIEWALAKDVLGLSQTMYVPTEILVGIEHTAAGAEPLSTLQKMQIMNVLARTGCRVSVFQKATAAGFLYSDFTSTNLLGVIEPSLKYPMVMSS